MQNKFYIFFFFLLTNLAYAKCDLGSESLNKFFDSKFSLSSDFNQSFVKDDKDPIEGSILLQRPNNLKITLSELEKQKALNPRSFKNSAGKSTWGSELPFRQGLSKEPDFVCFSL